MSDNQKKILEMLADKKISVDEAQRLLKLVDTDGVSSEDSPGIKTGVKDRPKYLRVTVLPDSANENSQNVDRVNVRVPMSLIRAGIKLTSLIPNEAMDKLNGALQEKGINFDVRNIKSEDIKELVEALGDMQVDVETAKGERVRVYVLGKRKGIDRRPQRARRPDFAGLSSSPNWFINPSDSIQPGPND